MSSDDKRDVFFSKGVAEVSRGQATNEGYLRHAVRRNATIGQVVVGLLDKSKEREGTRR